MDFCFFSTKIHTLLRQMPNDEITLSLVRELSAAVAEGADFKVLVEFAKKEEYEQVIVFTDGEYTSFDGQGLLFTWI